MANGFIDWLHKHIVQPVEQDIVHPIEHVAAPAVHFAAQEAQHPYLPQPVKQIPTDILHAPINFESHIAKPIEAKAIKSPFGRAAEDIGLGALRAGTGVAQAGSGVADIAGHLLTHHGGTSRISKSLNTFGKNIDITRQSEHLNKPLYESAQVAANVLPTLFTAGGSEAAEGATKTGTLEKATNLLKPLEEKGTVGRIAARTARSALNPKTLAANAGYQAYSAGQQASQGKKINPKSQAESLGVFQLGFPLAGEIGKETAGAIKPVLFNSAKGLISKFGEPAIKGAEKASGLDRSKVINDNEANMLRDEADRMTGGRTGSTAREINNTHAIARNIGLDLSTGSSEDKAKRIYDYLDQRRSFVNAHNQIAQGGYAKLPKSDAESLFATEPKSNELPKSQSIESKPQSQPSQKLQPQVEPEVTHTQEPESIKAILSKKSSLPDNTPLAGGVKPPTGNMADIAKFEELSKAGRLPDAALARRLGITMEPPTEADLETKAAYAKKYNLTPLQLEKDFNDMYAENAAKKNLTLDELSKLGPQEKLGVQKRRALIVSDKNQATKAQAELRPISLEQAERQLPKYARNIKERIPGALTPVKLAAKSAKAQSEALNQETDYQLKHAINLGDKLPEHDKQLFYKYDAGSSIASLLKQANKPLQFRKAATAYEDSLDNALATERAAGAATLRQHNYVPHNYAVSENWLIDHNIPEDQWIKDSNKNVKGFRDTSAKYSSYEQAEKDTGGALKPLYDNPIEDLKQYRAKSFVPRRNNLLATSLAKAFPDDITPSNVHALTDLNGETRSTNQAGRGMQFNVTDRLKKQLHTYQTAPKGPIDKVAGKTSNLLKRGFFLGTPFHYFNLESSFIGKNLLNPKNVSQGEKNLISKAVTKGGWQRLLENSSKDGSLMAARQMGVILPDESRLSRAASAFALTEVKNQLRKGVEPTTAEGLDIGEQINHLVGHRNDVTENIHPKLSKALSFGTLAPHWTTTQLGLLKDALTKFGSRGAAGAYARRSVAGKRALEAGLAVGGTAAITHHLPTVSQALNEAGFTPRNPIPNIPISHKTKSAEGQEMVLQTDPLGLAAGLATERTHFAGSRLSPAASFLQKVISNQNWNEEPLTDNPNNWRQRVENAALNSLVPIGAQNLSNVTKNPNNPSIVQGLEQDIGARLKTNPNDPQYVATQQYYKALNKVTNTLIPGSKGYGAFLLYAGETKDPVTGKYLYTPNEEQTVAKWAALKGYPDALRAARQLNAQLQKQGQKVDPFFSLKPNQQQQYMSMIANTLPLSAERTVVESKMPWLSKFENQQSAYYNSLPPANPLKPKNPIQYPNLSKQTNDDMNTYSGLSNSTAKDDFLNNHPNVIDAFAAIDNYDNQIRNSMGIPSVKGAPTASPQVEDTIKFYDALPKSKTAGNTDPATQHERSDWINAHPSQYNAMINYFDQENQYEINKIGAVDTMVGEPTAPSNQLKYIKEEAGDIATVTNPDGSTSYVLNPSLAYAQSGSGSGYSSTNYNYINKAYQQLHDTIRSKKPTVVKLKKQSGLAKPVKAKYKKIKVTPISVAPSSISRGKPKIGSKKKVVA